MRKLYFIINPKAKNGYCMKIWQQVEWKLQEVSRPYFAFFTEYPGHAKSIASQISAKSSTEQERPVIIAVGGDGTLHEVANGMINSRLALGFIPGGSGNDFSRGLKIPADPVEALEVILTLVDNNSPLIDVGKITFDDHSQHYFINNMGAGFDALISYEVNRSKLKKLLNRLALGRLIYVFFLIKILFTYERNTVQLKIDGKKHVFDDTWFATVSNQPFYGGGMKISPSAKVDDGILDIIVAHRLPRWKLLLVFISVFWGKHIYFKEVEVLKGRTISIQASSPLYVHGDGEYIGKTPLEIQVQPGSIEVLTRGHSSQQSMMFHQQEGREGS